MIRARDLQLHRISVAYEGFIVPEGIPLPQYTPRTEPLFVASVSAGTSSSLPPFRKKEIKRRKKKEKSEETVVAISESSDDFGIFDQPTNPEEDPDEMGIQRKPQKSMLELMEGQPGKSASTQNNTIPSFISSS